jgi:hypothetical protein
MPGKRGKCVIGPAGPAGACCRSADASSAVNRSSSRTSSAWSSPGRSASSLIRAVTRPRYEDGAGGPSAYHERECYGTSVPAPPRKIPPAMSTFE